MTVSVTVTVTCPSCRGSRKVMKLGGMTGNCDVCKGQGTVEKEKTKSPVGLGVLGDPEILAEQTEEDAKYETDYLTPPAQKEFVPPSKNMDVSNGKHKRNRKT